LLQTASFRRLILLGDIFCDLDFGRLKKDHWKLLSHIRKLSNPKRGIEVVWVEGNHDHGLTHVMSHLVGVRVYQEYEWTYRGVKHLAIHGHQFDGFLYLQKLDMGNKRIARWIDRANTAWLRLSSKVAAGAMAHARQRGCARVFCGHTHKAMRAADDGIEYFNSGCWVNEQATYIAIDEEGVHIREYAEGTYDNHSGEERSAVAAETAEIADDAGLPADAAYESLFG
jgi:UDP-2,3-diacylglucosamine pyrophosphatase LpxH